MKVLYVSKALRVAAYRGKLEDLGAHVEIRALIPDRWGVESPEPGYDNGVQRHVTFLHGHNHLHLYKRPGRALDAYRPDLVHIDEEPYSAVTTQLVKASARRSVPTLFFAWQNIDKRLPAPFPAMRRFVFRNARGAIAGTSDAATVLRRRGYSGPIAVIPQFGVNTDVFVPDPAARERMRHAVAAADEDMIVGFGGRLVEEKGAGILLEAVADVAGVRVVIAGDGPMRDTLEARARRADLRGRVHFLGKVASLDMPRTLAGFDTLALPSMTLHSWKEQFGRILVESMSCGVPVIGSHSGEIPRVVANAGLIVPENDVIALREAITSLRAAPDKRATLGARGRRRVLDRFTSEQIAAHTAAFYRELVA